MFCLIINPVSGKSKWHRISRLHENYSVYPSLTFGAGSWSGSISKAWIGSWSKSLVGRFSRSPLLNAKRSLCFSFECKNGGFAFSVRRMQSKGFAVRNWFRCWGNVCSTDVMPVGCLWPQSDVTTRRTMSTTHCEQAKTGIFEGLSCKSLNGACYATDEVGLGWDVIALLNLHAWLVLLHTWGWGGVGCNGIVERACWENRACCQSCKAWQNTEQLESMRLATFLHISWIWRMIPRGVTHGPKKRRQVTGTFENVGNVGWNRGSIILQESYSCHTPRAQAQNYGKNWKHAWHGFHWNFQKRPLVSWLGHMSNNDTFFPVNSLV